MDAKMLAKDGKNKKGSGTRDQGPGTTTAQAQCTKTCIAVEGSLPDRHSGFTKTTSDKSAFDVLDITVLMGGPSTEREVSLISGAAIADALVRVGHKVTRSDISPTDTLALDRAGIDVVFIALHGAFGESGEVQELCQRRGLRYVGSGVDASRLAMNKADSKAAFRRAGIATADWCVVGKEEIECACRGRGVCDHVAAERRGHGTQAAVQALGLPVVVKPIDGGSSVDVTIARDAATRDTAIANAVAKYGQVMVEKFIKGRELTVGILHDQALPVIEIRPARDFYDYTAKYSDCGTQYLFDHGLGQEQVAALQQSALAAHRALGCRDMSRVDFILDGDGVAHCLEINTIPGFTSHSLLPMAAAKDGIAFDQLVNRIVNLAMQRNGA